MNLNELPQGLPEPKDDGAADHLQSCSIPDFILPSTNGDHVPMGKLQGLVVFYIYPMTGRPDSPLPENCDDIPGARGCTPQSCSFRDHYTELQKLNAEVFGVSTQSTDYQLEAKQRLHLPFEMLSDEALNLKKYLRLPTFIVAEMELYKRITLIACNGVIEKVFYPIFPPGENADHVLNWLRTRIT